MLEQITPEVKRFVSSQIRRSVKIVSVLKERDAFITRIRYMYNVKREINGKTYILALEYGEDIKIWDLHSFDKRFGRFATVAVMEKTGEDPNFIAQYVFSVE